MKKCPECGNPSYDGAPVCGNCGYKFPKPKVAVRKRESIFEQNPEQIQEEKPKVKKTSNEPSTIEIIKEKKTYYWSNITCNFNRNLWNFPHWIK